MDIHMMAAQVSVGAVGQAWGWADQSSNGPLQERHRGWTLPKQMNTNADPCPFSEIISKDKTCHSPSQQFQTLCAVYQRWFSKRGEGRRGRVGEHSFLLFTPTLKLKGKN